ncbi:MAG: pyridoxal-phosphate dependent enzyme, partial [Bacteroidota bacterium]
MKWHEPHLPEGQDIEAAALRISPYIHRTPVLTSLFFNEMFEASLYFKCENFQKVGAFKSRGACNAVFSLPHEELIKGVSTHSSGNHAQALARAAKLAGTKAFIVMPINSSKVKVEAVKGYGGQIRFCEPTLEARESTLKEVIAETGAVEIHPYNNYHIICGQATAAREIVEDIDNLDNEYLGNNHITELEVPVLEFAMLKSR